LEEFVRTFRHPYLVIGAKGMLGSDLVACLNQSGICAVPLDLEEVDITSPDSVGRAIREYDPGLVVNVAALTDVDGCESMEAQAFRVNADGPAYLAEACKTTGSFLMHLSTDYVFDGQGSEPYKVDDSLNPLGVYGRSKAEGEGRVRAIVPDGHCIVRTQWLYGLNGKNFVEAIINQTAKTRELTVVDDQKGCPTFTADLSEALKKLIELKGSGTFHVTNSGETNWYDFAVKIIELEGIRDVGVSPISSETLDRPAPRPAYSVLDNSRYAELTGSALRSWEQGLEDYLKRRGARDKSVY
jgi:dTDP-4-dehydrorhamnose reductase